MAMLAAIRRLSPWRRWLAAISFLLAAWELIVFVECKLGLVMTLGVMEKSGYPEGSTCLLEFGILVVAGLFVASPALRRCP